MDIRDRVKRIKEKRRVNRGESIKENKIELRRKKGRERGGKNEERE